MKKKVYMTLDRSLFRKKASTRRADTPKKKKIMGSAAQTKARVLFPPPP